MDRYYSIHMKWSSLTECSQHYLHCLNLSPSWLPRDLAPGSQEGRSPRKPAMNQCFESQSKDSRIPKRRNAETPKRRNAETPKRRNAEALKRLNA